MPCLENFGTKSVHVLPLCPANVTMFAINAAKNLGMHQTCTHLGKAEGNAWCQLLIGETELNMIRQPASLGRRSGHMCHLLV